MRGTYHWTWATRTGVAVEGPDVGTGVLIKGSQCDSRSFASYSRMAAERAKNHGSAWLLQQTTSRQSTYP